MKTEDRSPTRALLRCGVIAGPLFTLAWAVEGATRAGYDPLRHPVSSLAIGPTGWAQVVSFVISGLLTLAFAVGLRRALGPRGGSTWGPLLVGVYAVGLIGAGVFVADPVSGYPPGTPDRLDGYSGTPAALHDLFSFLVFAGLPAACLVLARRFAAWGERRWAILSAVTASSSWPGSCSPAWPSTRPAVWSRSVGCSSARPSRSAGPGWPCSPCSCSGLGDHDPGWAGSSLGQRQNRGEAEAIFLAERRHGVLVSEDRDALVLAPRVLWRKRPGARDVSLAGNADGASVGGAV